MWEFVVYDSRWVSTGRRKMRNASVVHSSLRQWLSTDRFPTSLCVNSSSPISQRFVINSTAFFYFNHVLTAVWTEQHPYTCPTWQCLSTVPLVVSSVQRQPPISWYHQLVAHPLETVHLPWQVHEHIAEEQSTSSSLLNLQIISTFKKNLNHSFWTVILFVITCTFAVLNAEVTVRTIKLG